MNEEEDNLSEEGLEDPYESELKKVKKEEKKRIEEAKDDLTEGKIKRKRTEEGNNQYTSIVEEAFSYELKKTEPPTLVQYIRSLRNNQFRQDEFNRIFSKGPIIRDPETNEAYTNPIKLLSDGFDFINDQVSLEKLSPVLKFLPEDNTPSVLKDVADYSLKDLQYDIIEEVEEKVGGLTDNQLLGGLAAFGVATQIPDATDFLTGGIPVADTLRFAKRIPFKRLDELITNILSGPNPKFATEGGEVPNTFFKSVSEGSGGFKPEGNWQSKYTKNFSDTSKLQKYEEAAFEHRKLRHKTDKKDLMKDFIFEDGNPYITGDDGKNYLLVRRNRRVDKINFISKKNYELLPEEVILDRLLRKSGWTPGSRELREIKKTLNKQNFSLLSNPKYYEPLIEHGVGNVYLEHKIARGQSWFWNEVTKNPKFAPWLDKVMGPNLRKLGRNSEYNIRILFNQDYKKLKDGVEQQLNVINSKKKIGEKFIINIEDPQHVASSGNVDFAKMNNPGNISVLKAGTGEKVGVIPDYLMNLYSKGFQKKWKDNYKYLINRPGNEVPEFYRLYTKKVKNEASGKMVTVYETFEEWRKRVIGNRIDLILRKSSDTDALQIGEHVINDRSDFFELFDKRSGWVDPPSTIKSDQQFLDFE